MKIDRFEDLEIWKLSLQLCKKIYIITNKGDFVKDFGLRDQIRRASVSVNSNIAEGFERDGNNDLIRFLKISKGSAGEVKSQLHISFEIGYISKEEFNDTLKEAEVLSKQIGGFISYLQKKRNAGEFTR